MLEEKILICLEAGTVGWEEGRGREAGKQRRSRGFGAGLSSKQERR
jgi:hypothetical protein